MTPCRPSCPAGDCANCTRFDRQHLRQPAAEQPHCVASQADLHAGMDETGDWAIPDPVSMASENVTTPGGASA